MAVGVQASYRVGLDWLDSLCSTPGEQARPLGIFINKQLISIFSFASSWALVAITQVGCSGQKLSQPVCRSNLFTKTDLAVSAQN